MRRDRAGRASTRARPKLRWPSAESFTGTQAFSPRRIGVGLLFAALIWAALPRLVAALGATGRTQALAVDYLRIIIPSQPLLMLRMIGAAILRSHGDPARTMRATAAGALANALLDPILIFGLSLERTGGNRAHGGAGGDRRRRAPGDRPCGRAGAGSAPGDAWSPRGALNRPAAP